MSVTASQITSLMIVYSTVYSDTDERKPQSSASLDFVRGIHWQQVNSPHIGPVILCGKCFHFMTSSWNQLWRAILIKVVGILIYIKYKGNFIHCGLTSYFIHIALKLLEYMLCAWSCPSSRGDFCVNKPFCGTVEPEKWKTKQVGRPPDQHVPMSLASQWPVTRSFDVFFDQP